MRLLFLFSLIILSFVSYVEAQEQSIFSGRITRITPEAKLVRVKVDFNNVKYLNKRNKVRFWDERGRVRECEAYVLGKTNEHLLLRVPELEYCKRAVLLTEGAYLIFKSEALEENLEVGKELVQILLKKRLAVNGQLSRVQKEIDVHNEKVNAINTRYDVLRQKLEKERLEKVAKINKDKMEELQSYKNYETKLMEIDQKLEQYRIEDENLEIDRWALDPKLYYKK